MSDTPDIAVGKGCKIQNNVSVYKGVAIARYAFIGAKAVVARNVPDHALVVGNPGKPVGWICQCGERLTDELECLACDRGYGKTEPGLEEFAAS